MSVTGKFIRVRSEESQETGLEGLRISGQGSQGIVVINRTPFRNSPDSDLDGRKKGKVLDGKFKEDSGWILGSRVCSESEVLAEKLGKSLASECECLFADGVWRCGVVWRYVALCGVKSGTWY